MSRIRKVSGGITAMLNQVTAQQIIVCRNCGRRLVLIDYKYLHQRFCSGECKKAYKKAHHKGGQL